MRIRMYNVGFGDCFCIRDRKSSLLVDFGAANSKIEGRPRREVFDVIISDLTTIRKKNLLLTHFHPDHVSGLLYMMRYRRDAYEFEKIYLPDVFSGPEMKYTLALLLLADVTKKASLPGRRVSLFALAEALCARRVKIDLLSRGSEFEGKYTALWPDLSEVSRETEDVFNSLIENHEKAMTELVNIAEEVRQLFLSMTEETPEAEQKSAPLSEASLAEEDTEESESSLTGQTESGGENEGYTQEKLELIMEDTGAAAEDTAENYDGRIPLHEHYWCIKVPHHGTESHFFDFSSFSPENMMIPNGAYYDNSKKKSKNQRTSMQYGGLFYINDAHMYCSNCDCCDSYENGCSCREYDVISPAYYKDI